MIVVVGISHKSTPIAVRERIAIPEEQIQPLLQSLAGRPSIGEVLVLSTCNRVEFVACPDTGISAEAEATSREALAAELVAEFESRVPGIARHLYVHQGDPAVRHLFRVASSLDSLVLGEPQILGQLKDAMVTARQAGTLGRTLNRGVGHAIRTAKRVRTETALGIGQVSVPSVAVDLARQVFGDLRRHSVLLIGSGNMAESLARLMSEAGAQLTILGRNQARVSELAARVGGAPKSWEDLRSALVEADIVITSTRAPGHIITEPMVAGLRRARRGRSLVFVDLAVPRDVDPAVDQLDNVFCYNIDDFSRVVEDSLSSRRKEADRGEEIVSQEVESFRRWVDALRITPTVVALRQRFKGILQDELDRSLRSRLKHLGEDDRTALSAMLEAAVNKLCHNPTARLRETACDHEFEAYRAEELSSALDELFELSTATQSAPSPRSSPSNPALSEPISNPGHPSPPLHPLPVRTLGASR